MSVSDRIRVQYFEGSTSVGDITYTYTTGARNHLSESCPGNASPIDTQLTYTADVSVMKSLMILSTKDVTLTTNDDADGSPGATVALTANIPKIWSADTGGTNPFGAVDVTSLFVRNGTDTVAALVTVINTYDPTP